MPALLEIRPAQQDVEAKLLNTAYELTPAVMVMSILVVSLFGSLMLSYFPPRPVLQWVAAVIGCSLLRIALWACFKRAAPMADSISVWRLLYFVGVVAGGLGWSVVPTQFIAQASSLQVILILACLLGVCATAMGMLASQQAAMQSFFLVTLLPPLVTVFFTAKTGIEFSVAVMHCVGLICVMAAGWRVSRALRATLEAQHQLQQAVSDELASRLALEDSEQRYRTLAEWSPNPIAVFRDWTLLYVNPATVKLMGVNSYRDLVGKSVLDCVHADSRQRLVERIKLISEDSEDLPRLELQFVRQDATVIDVEIHGTSIAYDGSPAIHLAIRDITDRIRAETERESLEMQLRQSQKMLAIGTLAGGIAHDFNNIIAAILGNVELARQDLIKHRETHESLDEIRKAGLRARDLVQQILSFSRRQPADLQLIALPTVIEDSVRLLRSTLPPRVELSFSCEPSLPQVLANATQIQQVILNLCTNASQATQGKPGKINVQLATVLLGPADLDRHPALREFVELHPGRLLRLTISDTGCGIDAAVLSRIFEPFFTTKPVGEGTGLGLSVVHGIVESHHGAITVDSTVGSGSTFSIYFPVTPVDAVQSAKLDRHVPELVAVPDAETGVGKPRILYLDDEQMLLTVVKHLIERRGFSISTFSDQQAALQALRQAPQEFDLVATDYNMPGLSGLDVAREIRAIRGDLPVVIVSGFIDDTLRVEANSAGVRELIFKAGDVEQFCAAFTQLALRPASR